jgi:hypothetical protein
VAVRGYVVSRWTIQPLIDEKEFLWVQEAAECAYCDDMNGIVAYRDGMLVAGILLESWSHNSVTIHIRVDDPLVFKHRFAEECFKYIFVDAGRGVLIGITPANNEASLRFNQHIGLEEIYRIKDGYDVGIDYVVQELRKENCRYIEHGQEIHTEAA